MASFYNSSAHKVSGKDKVDNAEVVEQEIESLKSILTEQEVQVVDPTSVLSQSDIDKY